MPVFEPHVIVGFNETSNLRISSTVKKDVSRITRIFKVVLQRSRPRVFICQ